MLFCSLAPGGWPQVPAPDLPGDPFLGTLRHPVASGPTLAWHVRQGGGDFGSQGGGYHALSHIHQLVDAASLSGSRGNPRIWRQLPAPAAPAPSGVPCRSSAGPIPMLTVGARFPGFRPARAWLGSGRHPRTCSCVASQVSDMQRSQFPW